MNKLIGTLDIIQFELSFKVLERIKPNVVLFILALLFIPAVILMGYGMMVLNNVWAESALYTNSLL